MSRHPMQAEIEQLEERRLLAVTFTPNVFIDDSLLLHISGSRNNDRIVVSLDSRNPRHMAINVNRVRTILSVEDFKALRIDGNRGNDMLTLDDTYGLMPRPKAISGGEGNDTLTGAASNDEIFCGDGDDIAYGAGGIDTLEGGLGNDSLYGGNMGDSILGNEGDDLIEGQKGSDTIEAGEGNDTVYGATGHDLIHGEGGDDWLYGNDDNDTIFGDAGFDELRDGPGRDILNP